MASAPTLAKITRPRLRDVYARTRLFKWFDEARKRPVIWVTGPPGSGKTTLVSSYVERRKLPGLWYQLDGGDNDLGAFFYYLGLAAKRVAPRRQPLPLLTPEYALGLPTFSQNFFQELFTRLQSPFVVVFDNYQEVSGESDFHELLRTGLDQVPERGTVMILSRDDPPPALARLQINQAITELDWEGLRLTPQESRGMVNVLTHHQAQPERLNELYAKTQGWIAGLILLLEQRGVQQSAMQPVEDAVPQVLFDYFAGEVFDKTDAATQDFLLKTALLPDVSASMAQALSGSADAHQILDALNRRHYFTDRLRQAQAVYRYHPLFREFLLARARKTFSSGQLAQLQQKAAVLLDAAGQVEPAVELLLAVQDWAGVARLIGQQAPRLLAEGRYQTLEGWLNALPADRVEREPWLLYWLGACRTLTQPVEARAYLEKAFTRFKAVNDATGLYLAWCEIVDAYVFAQGDMKPLDRWLAALDGLTRHNPDFPSPEIEMRVVSSALWALPQRQPRHPDLPLWAERLETLLQSTVDANQRIRLGLPLLLYCVYVGDGPRARLLFDALRESAESHRLTAFMHITWCLIATLYRWLVDGTRDDAMEASKRGLEIAQASGVRVLDYPLLIQGLYCSLAFGQLDAAATLLRQLAPVTNSGRIVDIAQYYSLTSWEALLRGDVGRAVEYGRAGLSLCREAGHPFGEAHNHLRLAHAFIQNGEQHQATEHLAQAKRIGLETNSLHIEQACLMTEAQVAFDQGQTAEGLGFLRQGLAAGRRLGLAGNNWSRPRVETELCATALAHNIEVDYVQSLIRQHGLVPADPPWHLDNWPWPVKIYTLGRFSLVRDGKPVRFAVQAQRKRLELLKTLIALGGRAIPEDELSAALWPEAEGGIAHQDFATTLHRLRKLLGHEQAVVLRDRQVSLDPRYCWVDTWAFERLAGEVEVTAPILTEAAITLANKAIALYHGPFLGQESEQPLAAALRERLRSKFLRLVVTLGQHWVQGKQWAEAVACYQKGLEVDPLAEELYRQLMLCYIQLHRRAEALAVYARCRQVLGATLGITPSQETESLYERVRAAKTL